MITFFSICWRPLARGATLPVPNMESSRVFEFATWTPHRSPIGREQNSSDGLPTALRILMPCGPGAMSRVQRLIAERRFLTESDVLSEGLRLLQAQESLRTAMRQGFAQIDEDSVVPAEMVFAKAEERITGVE